MKKIWLELDVAGTKGDEAWNGIEKPKGFIEAGILIPKDSPCQHTPKKPHEKGEWREVWVEVEDPFFHDVVQFYKDQARVLAVETED